MSDEGLFATDLQVEDAREQRASYILRMPAHDFIRLTVEDEAEYEVVYDESSVLDEERAAVYPMPNLWVARSGLILAHNGRHRSGGAMKKFGSQAEVDVAVFMVDERRVPRYLALRNCPRILFGQYDEAETYDVDLEDTFDLGSESR